METKKTLKLMLFVIVVIVIAGYTYYQFHTIISGPKIEIISPTNGESFYNSLVDIKGITKNITHLSLNGRTIFVDKKGLFNEKLLIYNGLNIIEVKATDKFGRITNKILNIVLKESKPKKTEQDVGKKPDIENNAP